MFNFHSRITTCARLLTISNCQKKQNTKQSVTEKEEEEKEEEEEEEINNLQNLIRLSDQPQHL